MLTISGFEAFDRAIAGFMAEAHTEATQVAKGYVSETLRYILKTSPQYSGDFVANWNVYLGAPRYEFEYDVVNTRTLGTKKDGTRSKTARLATVFQEGSQPAQDHALAKAKATLSRFTLGTPVFFTNASEHTAPYSVKIERDKIRFRPENPSGGRVMERAMTEMGSKYTLINPTMASYLMGKAL